MPHNGGGAGPRDARVLHADLWGRRQEKYAYLEGHDAADTEWTEITPHADFYLFVPRDEAALERYNEFAKVTDVFPVHSVGIVTARDRFVIDFDRDRLERRIRQFRDPNMPDELVRDTFKLRDNRDWNMAEKRKKIQQDDEWQDKIVRCLYRPFDRRWIFYHYDAIDFGREDVMRHMLAGDNLGLCVGRAGQVTGPEQWDVCFCSAEPQDFNLFYRGGILALPLHLYPLSTKDALFAELDEAERRPNMPDGLLEQLAHAFGREPSPEEVFRYVYAVLYAPSYREKYAEFLKIDFPRVPFTADAELFAALAELGGRLVALHLLDSPELAEPIAGFPEEGENRVARTRRKGFRYEPKTQRVYINPEQYFAPVAPELWEYQIGGYQVLHKWLKDRKDRRLGLAEIKTYCRIVTALARTIEVQEEIDALYPEAEAEIVELDLPAA